MHLFVSYMLRAISIFVKDIVLYSGSALENMDMNISVEDLKSITEAPPANKTQFVSTHSLNTPIDGLNIKHSVLDDIQRE